MCASISIGAMEVEWKRSVFMPIPEKVMPKNVQTTIRLRSFHMLVRLSFKLGFSSTRTENFQMYKLNLEKTEEPEMKLPTSVGSLKKQESFRKASISALLTMPKALTVWITLNCGRF